MIPLGEIRIFDRSAAIDVRNKILSLAGDLQFDQVKATRLATATSEVVRHFVQQTEPATLCVSVDQQPPETLLVLEFTGQERFPEIDILREIFDRLAQTQDEGQYRLTLIQRVPHTFLSPTQAFITRQRGRISLKSRTELLEELREKNEQLQQYNAQLEDIVRARTSALEHANEKMKRDLDAGADYVRNLIPKPCEKPLQIDWRYIPSTDLGGDVMGYHAIDDDHLALYLLDVTGHGLDSCLLAVSVLNVVRDDSLPNTDFRRPGQVLKALNERFTMDKHDNKLFTIWYGVYHLPSRTLTWAGGGHPPTLVYSPGEKSPIPLDSQGPLMGMIPWDDFAEDYRVIEPGSILYLYSDGVFEIHKQGGGEWTHEEFVELMSQDLPAGKSKMDVLLEYARELSEESVLGDDFSILEVKFPLAS
ncbi:MAG: PP2C family protein-serine/threonine phosphatase [Pirellulaceae bacterium]